ncbi:MAG: PorP/SprF family type IX secretion system membrane protein [Bacteroidetes bacterium]|nr:PorP/SprF family type IX secretion system membrane protein [Bacteroidota bacterium]
MKKQLINFIFILCVQVGLAQDPLFTNSNQSLIYLNPSFSGSNGFIRNQFSFRNQWPQLPGQYVTYLNSFDMYFKKMKGGLSATFLHDDQANGTLTTDVYNIAYAQHFSLLEGKLKIIPSVQGGVFVKKLDISKLNFGDMIDPRRGFVFGSTEMPANKKTNFNFSSGILINYNHLFVGANLFNINQPDEGFLGQSKLPYRLSFHASYNLALSEKTLLHFFVRFQKQQNFYYNQATISCVLLRHLILGAGYKYSYSPYVMIGYKHDFFSVQFDYEKYYNSLSNGSLTAYEISASFNLRPKDLRKTLVDFERW